MAVLVIAEKASAAKRLAGILADGGGVRTRSVGRVRVHELTRQGEAWRVVPLSGHVVEVDYPEAYNSWSKVAPRELVRVDPVKRVSRRDVARALTEAADGADRVVVATDHDREGELIGLEVLQEVPALRALPVRRARFSSLTEADVLAAFEDPKAPDVDLAKSAEARQHVDLAWGAALTRFVSLAAKRRGKGFLSVGRVQSPTLALVVDRERAIEAFEPEPYWRVVGTFQGAGSAFQAVHAEDRFDDEAEADRALEAARRADDATVTSVDRRVKRRPAPPPFDTTTFLREATKLGMTAKQAMASAERLYTRGHISYPRTDNTVYPAGLDLKGILGALAGGPFGADARTVLDQDRLSARRGKRETTDHPPIHPTASPTKRRPKGRDGKVYELVVRRFLATLSPPSVEETVKAGLDVGGEPFEAEGKRLLQPGWRQVYPYWRFKGEPLPDLAEGQRVAVEDVAKEAKETEPPKRYSQGTLIKAMAKHGLGTKSTRHDAIQKLADRGYVRGKTTLVPTATGKAVVDALRAHGGHVVSPAMTARLEEDMERVAAGEAAFDEVVEASRAMLETVFDDLEAHEDEVAEVLNAGLEQQREEQRRSRTVLGPCPSCGKDMVVRKARKGGRFAGCTGYDSKPRCKTTFPLPQKGRVYPVGEVCGACGTPRVKVVSKGRKPWVLCLEMECDGAGDPG